MTACSEPVRGNRLCICLPRAPHADVEADIHVERKGVAGRDQTVLAVENNTNLRKAELFPLFSKPYRYDELARTVRDVLDSDNEPTPAAAANPATGTTQGLPDGNQAVAAKRV